MNANIVLKAFHDRGYRLFSGVPCSYLTSLINAVIDSTDSMYVNAANEGEAVAICSGAELGGMRAVAIFQNSGLGNAVSPLTSLNAVFRIPALIIVTWRGQPDGPVDEPQHALMGQIMPELLRAMEIPFALFPDNPQELEKVLDRASRSMTESGRPFSLLLTKGTIDPRPLESSAPTRQTFEYTTGSNQSHDLNMDQVLQVIGDIAFASNSALFATTGFTGRALYQAGDRENQFYMVGSMGCVSSLALGAALAQPTRQVIAIDGDGASIMRLGAMAAIAAAKPKNLTHILLDNGVHDSTGGQATLAAQVDLRAVAAACGYPSIVHADSLDSLRHCLEFRTNQLRLIYIRTASRSDRKLPRPVIKPPEVAQRMRSFLQGNHNE